MIINCNECKLEEGNVMRRSQKLKRIHPRVLFRSSSNGEKSKRDDKWLDGNCNWRQRESNVRCSSYRYKQVEQNYVREIRSISYDHSVDLIVLETGMRRRAMKRRLRESAGMEPVVAYGFGSGSSNFVRRVPQGSFSRLRRRLLLALFGLRFR